jgi:hypothetical protein
MTGSHTALINRLKRLGYARDIQMKLYGQTFELTSDPIVVNDNLVFVDGIEKKTRKTARIRIPLMILRMAQDTGVQESIA